MTLIVTIRQMMRLKYEFNAKDDEEERRKAWSTKKHITPTNDIAPIPSRIVM
jgi:hypothetical protein